MRQTIYILIASVFFITNACNTQQKQAFEPTFGSLEQADPVPEWFKDAKFGIYFHWGVYSVPAFANEWYPRSMYIQGTDENKHHIEKYGQPADWPYNNFITGARDKNGDFKQFAPKLKSEGGKFDPEEWAQLFADAGARFAGPVAEHHDGYSMWASQVNPWNAKDLGPKLDLVRMLTDAIRKKDMKVILSMHHAYNITGFYEAVPEQSDPKLQTLFGQQGKEKNEALWLTKHKEIIDMYKPDIIWQDFNLHLISEPVLLEFLSYYYNRAGEWNKEVVATFKDGLNKECAVLDYERGGPVDITQNYWLTDDAISSTSWSYSEGLEYYSKKQILHGFLDRISKNGNLLLNISPMADGSIPQGQKEILTTMGDWLKKYGEAVYATRAWEKYGEGPTHMGASHGIFTEPKEGTSGDIRYTRSKDNSTLYAILLGWDQGQKEVVLSSLSEDRIDLQNLGSVELITGKSGEYTSLAFNQDEQGLTLILPDKQSEELAYVLKLSFKGTIPALNRYAEISEEPHYFLLPGGNMNDPVVGSDLSLTNDRNNTANQWKLKSFGNGYYCILSRDDEKKALSCNDATKELIVEDYSGNNNQIWKIDYSYNSLLRITNKQFPEIMPGIPSGIQAGNKVELMDVSKNAPFGWRLLEVCKLEQEAFSQNDIPGTIEAEDFDLGCPSLAYSDNDEYNSGQKYRPDQPVDIDTCVAGGYVVGWTNPGEWLTYTVNIKKAATYKISFYVATIYNTAKMRLEYDEKDLIGTLEVPNTVGFQNWEVVEKTVTLEAGKHELKCVIEGGGFNLDKMVFEEVNH